ncbi:MAG: hypothetical protein WA584_23595 [Pyrinomonadaceae bacterium]
MPEIKILREDLRKAKEKFEAEGYVFERDADDMWAARRGDEYFGMCAYLAALLNWIANDIYFIAPSKEPEEKSVWVIPEVVGTPEDDWSQPPRELITIAGYFARMSKATFNALKDNSNIVPSNFYVGKMWKSQRNGRWRLCWFDEDKGAKHPEFVYREIEIV